MSGTRSLIWAICVPTIFHFFMEIEEEWHTISNFGDLCANNFSFSLLEAEPAWHTKPRFTDLCAKVDRGRLERQRPHGTQNPKKPICVPKLSGARPRDSARMAHKTQIYRFVCQSYLAPG
ncbi:MAG: hypothetical protein IKH41_02860, partial [Clostridia bacterium]|nr:hypothetical protein [Clostridia bacterium]